MQFVEAIRGIISYIHPRNIDTINDCQWRSNSSSSLQQFTVIVVHCISFVAIADTYSTTLTLNNKIKRENRRHTSFLHSMQAFFLSPSLTPIHTSPKSQIAQNVCMQLFYKRNGN